MTPLNRIRSTSPARQRGAALAVGLILLVVMTLLAVSMSQSTRLQERISGNARDMNVALQSVEAGLRDGEGKIAESGGNMTICNLGSGCDARKFNGYDTSGYGSSHDLSKQDTLSWWVSNGQQFGASGAKEITQAANDPYFVIEERGLQTFVKSVNDPPQGRAFYTVTAHANGMSDTTHVIASSVFVVFQ